MAAVSVKKALEYVADHPQQATDVMLDVPVWELIARGLFVIANSTDMRRRGSRARSLRAQKMIMDRMVGTRRSGTHPVRGRQAGLGFVDLTGGELDK